MNFARVYLLFGGRPQFTAFQASKEDRSTFTYELLIKATGVGEESMECLLKYSSAESRLS